MSATGGPQHSWRNFPPPGAYPPLAAAIEARLPSEAPATYLQEPAGALKACEYLHPKYVPTPLQTLTQALAANLFAFSIIPYAGFLYYLTKSKAAPGLMLFGWYFLLAFVGVSIPAGIYGKLPSAQVYRCASTV